VVPKTIAKNVNRAWRWRSGRTGMTVKTHDLRLSSGEGVAVCRSRRGPKRSAFPLRAERPGCFRLTSNYVARFAPSCERDLAIVSYSPCCTHDRERRSNGRALPLRLLTHPRPAVALRRLREEDDDSDHG